MASEAASTSTNPSPAASPDAPQDNGPRRPDLNSAASKSRGSDTLLKNADLHGSAPDSCPVALLIIDMINDMEFEGGEVLYDVARPLAERILALKQRCHEAGVPVVYVNDNFGRWQSDFQNVVQHVLQGTKDGEPGGQPLRGRPIAQMLEPGDEDYFVLKPKHSGFYSTTLDLLLKYLGSRTLILTGVAGDICVLFTANDAYMRDFEVVVPRDGIASEKKERNTHALEIMAQVLKASTPLADEIQLQELLQARSSQ